MTYKYSVDKCYVKTSDKLNILIVDDDKISSDLFRDYLCSKGYNVTNINEGIQCVSDCMTNEYDIIFLDYHIGDVDGVELADCLKDVLKIKSKIYAYTGDNNPATIKKFKQIGMDGVLFKPVNLSKLNNIITNIQNKTTKNIPNEILYF